MITHVVFDGVAESSLGVGLDIVSAAGRLLGAGLTSAAPQAATRLRQRVVSLDGSPVRSGTGRPVAVDGALSTRGAGQGDIFVVPGIFGATEKSLDRLLARAATIQGSEVLATGAAKGAMLAASCSATFVLASSGVLDGQHATTTWWLAPAFARRFPSVTLSADRMVVEAGHVLTAGSAFAHADLMLALITRIAGPSLAQLVARYLVLDERPSQSRYMVMEHLRVAEPALQKAERFVTANLTRQISLDELAHAAGVSPRTLARRVAAALGMTPHAFVQRIRVDHAAHLLQTSQSSVDEIAARVGYADAAAFRRVFRRHAGESPRATRRLPADSPTPRR